MKLVGLKCYQYGFTGVIEETEQYVLFNCTRSGKVKRLIEYDKTDYVTYGDFLNVLAKFIPLKFFFMHPFPISRLTLEELERISEKVDPLRFHVAPFDPNKPRPPRQM
jgi:hypothetical protein